MKLRVGICDDEKSVIEILQQCMEQYQMHQDVELEVESFTNGNESGESISCCTPGCGDAGNRWFGGRTAVERGCVR